MVASALLVLALALAGRAASYNALIERARAGDDEPALTMLREQGRATNNRSVQFAFR